MMVKKSTGYLFQHISQKHVEKFILHDVFVTSCNLNPKEIQVQFFYSHSNYEKSRDETNLKTHSECF